MTRDAGNLSIDFLVGFTVFIIAFIWVISMIPGLLIGLQAYTIDYDAVAYRTGVILVEDPGEPALPQVPWELNDKKDVVRFGLAISRDTPNILSQDKVNRFFCQTVFSYPDDYQERAIFGNYPYRFNISLWDIEQDKTLYVGDSLPGSYGTIRRLVQIKGTSNATINADSAVYNYKSGDNETEHEFTIMIDNKELLEGIVQNPAYQINTAREPILINITNINSTLYPDRRDCFNIRLAKIYAKDEDHIPIHLLTDLIIDGIPRHAETESDYAALPSVNNNISIAMDPTFLPWSNYPQVYLTLTFNLEPDFTDTACGPLLLDDEDPIRGSRFFNNSLISPFEYNYDPSNVTQPSLRDAVMEVDVGSGNRVQTGMLVQGLNADFDSSLIGGTEVKFRDRSIGSPTEWKWEYDPGSGWTQFGTLSVQSYTFPAEGTYDVRLTVTDTDGNSDQITKSVAIKSPDADFSYTPNSGGAPLMVIFTDSSTNTPTSWKWEYNTTPGGGWTQFSTTRNPGYSFPTGTYDIRLTANNTVGGSIKTKGAITVKPLPVPEFTANQTAGAQPFPVLFTGTSANGPITSWKWEYQNATTPWTLLDEAAIQNPTQTFTTGTYDIRLTAQNAIGSNTTTVPGYIVVTATPLSHNIEVTEGVGGTIVPNQTVIPHFVQVNDGGSKTFAITPNPGYFTVNVLVDGVSQGAISSYTFTNVIEDHVSPNGISATFAAYTPETLYYNGFNTSGSWSDSWNPSNAIRFISGCSYCNYGCCGCSGHPSCSFMNNAASIQLTHGGSMQRTIPTSGYSNIVVSFALGANSLETSGWPSYVPEYVEASWYDGSSWTTLKQIDYNDPGYNHLNSYTYTLPAAANNNANFRLRFRLSSGTGDQDYGFIDDVRVTGTHS